MTIGPNPLKVHKVVNTVSSQEEVLITNGSVCEMHNQCKMHASNYNSIVKSFAPILIPNFDMLFTHKASSKDILDFHHSLSRFGPRNLTQPKYIRKEIIFAVHQSIFQTIL